MSSEKKKRNPIERLIVWGGIGVLVLVVLVEARAQRGYSTSLAAIQDAMANNEEVELSLDAARALMALAPSEAPGAENVLLGSRQYVFSWASLFKSGQFELTLNVSDGEDPQVLSFTTSNAPAEELPALSDMGSLPSEAAPDFSGMAGQGFPGGGGPRSESGGGGGFEPPRDPLIAKLDTDGDGEISTAEMDAADSVLRTLDTDGDGDLSSEEFAPGGFRPRGGRGDADDGGNRPERPRRPVIED